jgi:hypothetical protein
MTSEPVLESVLAKAAELQALVPRAVLVGGAAAAYHVGHRQSFDHDHVVTDLADRFETILEHLEALGDWSLARAQPGKIILGSLGGIETGIRQLRRTRPLETEVVTIGDRRLVVPSLVEILRIKAWLAVTRNQTRDYLDLAALADRMGPVPAARVLLVMDDYYADLNRRPDPVATQVVRQLSDPRPRDERTTRELDRYKGLDRRWHRWDDVRSVLGAVAEAMLT